MIAIAMIDPGPITNSRTAWVIVKMRIALWFCCTTTAIVAQSRRAPKMFSARITGGVNSLEALALMSRKASVATVIIM